jgi:hypothetical protein
MEYLVGNPRVLPHFMDDKWGKLSALIMGPKPTNIFKPMTSSTEYSFTSSSKPLDLTLGTKLCCPIKEVIFLFRTTSIRFPSLIKKLRRSKEKGAKENYFTSEV